MTLKIGLCITLTMMMSLDAHAVKNPLAQLRVKTVTSAIQSRVKQAKQWWQVERHQIKSPRLIVSHTRNRADKKEGGPTWILGDERRARTGEAKTIVFFHGLGQVTDNIIINRLASALKFSGIDVNVVSMPTGDGGRAGLEFIKSMADGKVVVAGHSAGGSQLSKALSAEDATWKLHAAFSVNTGGQGRADSPVPTLVIAGEYNNIPGESTRTSNRQRAPKNVEVIVPKSDHSLRNWHQQQNKKLHDYTLNTWKMNLEVAQEIGRLIANPHAYVANANLRWAGKQLADFGKELSRVQANHTNLKTEVAELREALDRKLDGKVDRPKMTKKELLKSRTSH